MDKIIIKDESGDKEYFTIIPNYIANHSAAIDQSLYFQMKRLAGENGVCYAGYRYFLQKMGIGYKAYHKSLNYLLMKKWISFLGTKEIETSGGKQMVKSYKINDIWKVNNTYYRGGAERKHLPLKVVLKANEGGAERKQKKNIEERTKRASSETHLQVIELFDSYKQLFVEIISDEPPHFTWGKCEKLTKPLIRKYGLERMKDMITAYIHSDDPFYKKNNWGLEVFLAGSTINALLPKTYGHK